MAGASDLFDKINAYKPVSWDWSAGGGARTWLDALCTGFVNMWQAGVTTVYTWPGSGPETHTHTIATLTASVMRTPLYALNYTSRADRMFNDICIQVATYVAANTTFDTQNVATISHLHAVTAAGSGSTLKSAILSALSYISGSHVDSIIHAIAYGIIDFVAAYGKTQLDSGNPAHSHQLDS